MKFMGFLAGIVAAATCAGAAHAEGRYAAVALEHAGSTAYDYGLPIADARIKVDADAALSPSIAYGQKFGKLRAEVGLSYASRDAKSTIQALGQSEALEEGGKLKTTALDVTGYYDFPAKGRFQPYVGLGVGVVRVKINDGLVDDSTTTAKIQGVVGASVHTGKTLSVFGDVRLSRVGKFTVKTTNTLPFGETNTDVDLTSTDIRIGLRKSFEA